MMRRTLLVISMIGLLFGIGLAGIAEAVSGDHKLLVILVNFDEDPNEPYSISQVEDLAFNSPTQSVKAFYQETSYGQVTVSGQVMGWLALGPDSDPCNPDAVMNRALAAVDLANPGVDFNDYQDGTVVVIRSEIQDCLSTYRKKSFITSDGLLRSSAGFVIPEAGNIQDAITRAVGYGLGIGLPTTQLDCDTPFIDDECKTTDGVDAFDVMGDASGHLNSVFKERLDWFEPNNVVEVDPNGGVYTLEPLEVNSTGIQALKIPLAYNSWYYVENREAIGFDSFIASSNPVAINGVILRKARQDFFAFSELLNLLGRTGVNGEIAVGQEFYFDGQVQLAMTVDSRDPNTGQVQLTFHYPLEPQLFPVFGNPVALEGTVLRGVIWGVDPQGEELTYSIGPTPPGTSVHLLGDVNQDGVLDSLDRDLIDVLDDVNVIDLQSALADVNLDGNIDKNDGNFFDDMVDDATLVRRVVVWLPGVTDGGQYGFNVSVQDPNGLVTANMFNLNVLDAPVWQGLAAEYAVARNGLLRIPLVAEDDASPVDYDLEKPGTEPQGSSVEILGDVTEDGLLDPNDSAVLSAALAEIISPSRMQVALLDMDHDGALTSNDETLLSGLISDPNLPRSAVFAWIVDPNEPDDSNTFRFSADGSAFVEESTRIRVGSAEQRFKCYRAKTNTTVDPPFSRQTVTVTDALGTRETRVLRPRLFCTPVDVGISTPGIQDLSTYMTCYKASDQVWLEPLEPVKEPVTHVLGSETLELRKSSLLCTRSEKDRAVNGYELDPFRCYRSRNDPNTPKLPRQELVVSDLLESKNMISRQVRQLCYPADIDGLTSQTVDPATRLSCHRLRRSAGEPKFIRQDVVVRDLFGEQTLTLTGVDSVCLMSPPSL